MVARYYVAVKSINILPQTANILQCLLNCAHFWLWTPTKLCFSCELTTLLQLGKLDNEAQLVAAINGSLVHLQLYAQSQEMKHLTAKYNIQMSACKSIYH